MTLTLLLQTYAQRIRNLRRANPDVPEPALAREFQTLLEGLLPLLPHAPRLVIVPEFHNPGVGRPDIALMRQGAPARAFVELKAPSKPSDPSKWRAQDKKQYERFKELRFWAACNFSEIRLLHRDEEIADAVIVPDRVLRADQDDARANRTIAEQDTSALLSLLEQLAAGAGEEPAARDAQHLAGMLAHSARLVRGIVNDRLAELRQQQVARHPLLDVRQEFRDILYSHPEAAGYSARDFDELFSAAFAQTLAFGLLLVREATGFSVGADAWERMPEEHPLMRTALRVLSQVEVVRDIGIGFDVICDTVNSFAPEILSMPPGGRDPILYFYEDFLQTFDTEARRNFGVYYTPLEVVQYMVGALDRALRENFGTAGLADPSVTILDPAAGTGTFLLGIAERVRSQAVTHGPGMAALALRDLAGRMFGFELLVGPYAVAHFRIHHTLRQPSTGSEQPIELPRLGVFLADTLAAPGAASQAGPLGFVSEGIANERHEANRIKAEQPILAIIGNPPYKRLEEGENRTLVGDWMDSLWDDLKAPVRDAGEGGQLNTFPELSVAFWRWAIWKIFESENAPGRGVVALITNRKFLTGWPYAGLRKMMREKFDRIEIIDLRGDLRRGERAGVESDQGVFNIQVGTATILAIADGSRSGSAAEVYYNDSWMHGFFSRQAKFEWLNSGADIGRLGGSLQISRGLLDDMRPEPFQNGDWASLRDCFIFSKSGMKSGNDEVFSAVARPQLRIRVTQALGSAANWSYDESFERHYSYRPLDQRWFYNDLRRLNRPGPELQQVWGVNNYCIYALPGGTGEGPAVWCYGLLPDYHAFRGSYGGYAFPAHDRRPTANASNISSSLIANLSAAYGEVVSAEDIFDSIVCLLSATSYTLRFAEDLEDVFPHIPFPARNEVFLRAARIGRDIRAVETFERPALEQFRPLNLARLETQPNGNIVAVEFEDGTFSLSEDGSGRITGVPDAVWNFSVSGYDVLPRWLRARIGLPATLLFVNELRDICGRIAELLDLFRQADIVLNDTLHEALSRDALSLAPEGQDADDRGD